MTVSTAGVYTFSSTGSIDSCGYLYGDSFSRDSPSSNLITFDDGRIGNGQFRFIFPMEANISYTLIATTYFGRNTGDYTLVVSGVGPVTLVRIMEPPEPRITRE